MKIKCRLTEKLTPLLVMLTLAGLSSKAQTLQPPFTNDYSIVDLGAVPGLPTPYGGLTFKAGDPNTILIGGSANDAAGKLYSIGVRRDVSNVITGFNGTATFFAQAANNDGGVAYGPGGVLFLARWPINELGQTKPGSTNTDKIVDLNTIGVVPSPGGLNFVPAGFPGAGQLKMVSYAGGQWYTVPLSPDGTGTFNLGTAIFKTNVVGSPEGIVYVPPGSPQFASFDSVLVCEYGAGKVATYELDGDGDPIPGTRRDFITGLSGAEGAVIDPLTGDFLFSTFGAGNQVIVVRGFQAPTANLAVFKSAAPSPGTAGSPLTYTITLSNLGPNFATSVVLTDALPAAVSFVSSVPSQGNCQLSNGVVTCALGSIANNAFATVSIVVTPASAGLVTNTAIAAAAEADPNSTNNSATIVTTIQPSATNQPPVARCRNIVKSASASCNASATAAEVDNGSFDPDGGSVTLSLNPPGPYPKGTNAVTLTVNDDEGGSTSCNATVTVVDDTPPAITCPADVTVTIEAGVGSATVNFDPPGATDNCGNVTIGCTPASGSVFPVGSTTVTCTATDGAANSNQCTFTVTVQEQAPETHDLAITKLKAPKNLNLNSAEPAHTKRVIVTIQNRSAHSEVITNYAQLARLVRLEVRSLDTNECADIVPVLLERPPQKKLPITIKSRAKLNVFFEVTFDCARDTAKGAGHEDFTYAARVFHEELDGNPDTHPECDTCPRGPLPGNKDPNPNGKILDKGCGAPAGGGIFGNPVLTDVFLK